MVPGAARQGGVAFAPGSFNSLTLADAEVIHKEIGSLAAAAPSQRGNAQIVADGANWNTRIEGETPDYLTARDWLVSSGRFFDDHDALQARKIAVLGATVAKELFPNSDPVGERVRISGGAYEIVGVLSKGQSGLGQDHDDIVLAPLQTFKRRVSGRQGRANTVSQISVKAESENDRFAKARFDAGVATRTDLAQAGARLAQARTQLIQAQGSLVAANETYRRLVGVAAGALEPAPAVIGLPPSLEDALALAVQQSPTLISAHAAELSADAAVSASRAARGPNISLEAGSSLSGGFQDDGLGNVNADSVGQRFSLPLFIGGAASSRRREARALREASGLDRTGVERQLRETVTTAWTGAATARSAYASAQEQVTAAETAYRGVTLEQEGGLRATAEALDQENDRLAARLALAGAERELAVSERRLLLAVGWLTEPR